MQSGGASPPASSLLPHIPHPLNRAIPQTGEASPAHSHRLTSQQAQTRGCAGGCRRFKKKAGIAHGAVPHPAWELVGAPSLRGIRSRPLPPGTDPSLPFSGDLTAQGHLPG